MNPYEVMRKSIIAVMVLLAVLAAQHVSATEFLFNWHSDVGGGVYDGFVKEKASAIGSNFSPSGVDSFSFGSPSGTYTMANSFLNTDFGGADFIFQGRFLVSSGGFEV